MGATRRGRPFPPWCSTLVARAVDLGGRRRERSLRCRRLRGPRWPLDPRGDRAAERPRLERRDGTPRERRRGAASAGGHDNQGWWSTSRAIRAAGEARRTRTAASAPEASADHPRWTGRWNLPGGAPAAITWQAVAWPSSTGTGRSGRAARPGSRDPGRPDGARLDRRDAGAPPVALGPTGETLAVPPSASGRRRRPASG